MARKVKFALEMADGTKVRSNLEELRVHFDMESIARYYLSGKLLEWLEDRYYDDEAAKIEELDKDAPNLNAQLCAIIGVDASKYDALDLEAVERLNEKKTFLRQKTSDSTIIDNAMITALNQEDLADLLDLESPVIYLCGEKFNIPIRVEHKKYIGVLGTPKIEIRSTSDADLKAKDIIFENVLLPWDKNQPLAEPSPMQMTNINIHDHKDELINMMKTLFKNNFYCEPWLFLKLGEAGRNRIDSPDESTIKTCLTIVCKNKYSYDEIVHLCMDANFTIGFALTYDSICFGGKAGHHTFFYKDIIDASYKDCVMTIITNKETFKLNDHKYDSMIFWNGDQLQNFLLAAKDIAGNFY